MLDVLAIIAAVAIVVGLFVLLPALRKPQINSARINCVNNLKQVGLAYRLWAGDNGDKFPMQVSTNTGGTMELVQSGAAYPHFQVMSNELSTPKILKCPEDKLRVTANHFGPALRDTNISYFIGLEADETLPSMWLAGDRNLTANGLEVKPGLFTFKANKILGWSAQLHKHQGNLGLADGSAQQVTNTRLQRYATNALHTYVNATTNTSFRLAMP
jgi:hypothetical protein